MNINNTKDDSIKKRTKSENSRLNLLYVVYVLRKYTDETHPLSIKEITDYVNKEFGYRTVHERFMSNDTVKRLLDEMVNDVFLGGFSFYQDNKFNFEIVCVRKEGEEYVRYNYDETKHNIKKYYYYRSYFSVSEIRMLIDVIETHNYFSEEDVLEVIHKLIRLQPKSFSNYKFMRSNLNIRDDNSLLFMNIDMLNGIINQGICAKITYCTYDYHKKLVPRQGYPKVIFPMTMMWSNGFCYLLTHSPKYKNVVIYRVDRITDIEEVKDKNPFMQKNFNPAKYRLEHPIMFGGKKERVELLCRDTGKNYIMNTIMDYFGQLSKVTIAEDELLKTYLGHDSAYYKEKGITWLKIVVEAALGGVELWASQYCNDCVILSPKESREHIRKKIQEGLEMMSYYMEEVYEINEKST